MSSLNRVRPLRLQIERQLILGLGSYDLFIVDHVRLLVSLAPISVNEIGQEYDEEISQSVFHAAKTSVANSVIGLSDGGFLRFSSNLGVIMIMYVRCSGDLTHD